MKSLTSFIFTVLLCWSLWTFDNPQLPLARMKQPPYPQGDWCYELNQNHMSDGSVELYRQGVRSNGEIWTVQLR